MAHSTSGSRLRSALAALALASALAGTISSVSSAAAADLLSAQSKPHAGVETGPGQPQPSNTLPPLKFPDLEVKYQGVTTNGNTSNFQYRVRNLGSAGAKDVKLERVCVFQDGPYSNTLYTNTSWQPVGNLAAGATLNVTLSCTPGQHEHSEGSSMTAHTTTTEIVQNNNGDSTNNLGPS